MKLMIQFLERWVAIGLQGSYLRGVRLVAVDVVFCL